MRDPAHGVDFSKKFGKAAMLMNVGLYGLFIVLYYNIIGATFNAVTFGCIFCMLACCNSGSNPKTVWPIMIGYVAASYLMGWLAGLAGGTFAQGINAQAIVVGLCFANGLSPISGKYGWPFGILAGALHYCLVTSVPLLHGGFCRRPSWRWFWCLSWSSSARRGKSAGPFGPDKNFCYKVPSGSCRRGRFLFRILQK